MKFHVINKDTWDRTEYFDHYWNNVPCSYSLTVELDITPVIHKHKKIYPTLLYNITKAVNSHEQMRMGFDKDGNLGIFDEMIPLYTIFHKDTHTFSNIWTEFHENENEFYKAYINDLEEFKDVHRFEAKPYTPPHIFYVSMIPWITFKSFELHFHNVNQLAPIFTMGKYYKDKGKYYIPLSIQVHHSVCDGYHVSCFVEDLQKLILGEQ